RPRRVVHRDDQGLADPRDRDDEALLREPRVNQRAQRPVQNDRGEVEEIDVELEAQRPPHLLLGDKLQSDDDLAEGLLPSPLLGEGRRELLRREQMSLDQELAELRPAPVALEDRLELAARDDLLGDEDVAERQVGLGLALHAQRRLHLGLGREILGDEKVTEPEDARLAARGAVADSLQPSAVRRGQVRRFNLGPGLSIHWLFQGATSLPTQDGRSKPAKGEDGFYRARLMHKEW